jgi:hypothetical protein
LASLLLNLFDRYWPHEESRDVITEADDVLIIVVAPRTTLITTVRGPVALRTVPFAPWAAIRLFFTGNRNRAWGRSLFSRRLRRLRRASRRADLDLAAP